MSGIITRKFRVHNASQFKEQFDEAAATNLYLFIGGTTPWDDESTPPDPIDRTEEVDYSVWNNIAALKKASPSDVSFAATRINWTANTVYGMYQSNANFYSTQFYVITSDYRVYKCLDNNDGSQSTVKPSSVVSNSSFTTADGYRWKYLYTVSAADALKYLTINYMPVKTLTSDDGSDQWDVQTNAVNSAIETIVITSGGSLYRGHVATAASGGASTITLAANASAVDNYYNSLDVYISSGASAGDLRNIIDYNGTTKVATVNTAFSESPDSSSVYNVGPKITINGTGTEAKAYSTVSGGSITNCRMINIGQDYSQANVVFTANGGSGAVAIPHFGPYGGHGSDPVQELIGHNVIININLTGSESNTLFTNNDFRVVGLVADPIIDANGSVATGTVYNQTTKLNISGASGTYTQDELVTGGTSGATGYFVEYAASSQIMIVNIIGEFQTSETVTGGSSGATGTISSIVSPTVRKGSGDILYIQNRSPVTRTPDQEEDMKVIIKF